MLGFFVAHFSVLTERENSLYYNSMYPARKDFFGFGKIFRFVSSSEGFISASLVLKLVIVGFLATTGLGVGSIAVIQTGVLPVAPLFREEQLPFVMDDPAFISPLEASEGEVVQAVLAETTTNQDFVFTVNVPASFTSAATFAKDITVSGNSVVKGDLTVSGSAVFSSGITTDGNDINLGQGQLVAATITASNVVYSITVGNGLSSTGGQRPTFANTGVLSLGGKTGAVTLAAGSGISIDGVTITNSDTGSGQKIFKTITVGSSSFSAGSNTDTLTFAAGSGVDVSVDTTNKKVTFSGSSGFSGWVDDGSVIRLSTSTDSIGIGTTNPSTKFHIVGASTLAGATTVGGATTDLITFTGRMASGTALLPAVDLGADLGSNSLRFNNLYVANLNSNSGLSTAGQAIFTYSATTTTYGEAAVQINPTSPVTNGQLLGLGIAGAQRAGIDAEGDLTIGYAGGAGTSIPATANPFTVYNHGTTNLFTINTSGNVGIGTTTVSSKLTLVNSDVTQTSGTPGLYVKAGLAANSFGAAHRIVLDNSPSLNWNSAFSVEHTGNSTAYGLSFGSAFTYEVSTSDFLDFRGSSGLGFHVNSGEIARINSSGNLGIGTTSPIGLLHVEGAPVGKALVNLNYTGSGQSIFTASASGSTLFNINATGRVIIRDSLAPTSTTPKGMISLEGGAGGQSPCIGFSHAGTNYNYLCGAEANGVFGLASGSEGTVLQISAVYNGALGLTATAGNPAGSRNLSMTVASGSISSEALAFQVAGTTATLTGSYATQRFSQIGQSTITAASALSISSEASTLAVAGAPIAAGSATIASSSAIKVKAATVNSGVTNAYGLSVEAPYGATNNYAATFLYGNVGIGTTAPIAKLHVMNSNQASQLIVQNSSGTGLSLNGDYPTLGFNSYYDNTSWKAIAANYTGDLGMDPTNGLFSFVTGNNPGANNNITRTTRMVLTNGGNVGIGTTAPAYKTSIVTSTTNDRALNISHTATIGTNYGVYSSVAGAAATASYGGYFSASGAVSAYGVAIEIGNATITTGIALDINAPYSGGTTLANINTSAITGGGSSTTNAYGINLGGFNNLYGSTFGSAYGINIGTNNVITTTKYGINIGALSGTGTTHYGLKIGGVSGATTNYGLYTESGTTVLNATSGNVGIGTTTPTGKLDVTDTSNTAASFSLTNNTATTIGAGANTLGVLDLQSTSLTTGNFMNIELNALTSGKGMNVTSTSTALTTGNLFALDWSPSSVQSTAATGDLLKLNIGANASNFAGNLLNILDNSSSIFSVSKTAVTSSIPYNNTAPGDVSIAYDVNFTNPTASFIKSLSALTLQAGESYNSSDLTLKTYNQGSVVVDSAVTTGTGVDFTNSTITTGTGLYIAANALTTGNAVNIVSTSTAGGASGASYLLNLSRSGVNANTAHTAYGLYATVTNTNATSGTNTAAYLSASGATTANYAIYSAAGQNYFASNGAASTPVMTLAGTWFTGGTATTTKPQLLIEPTGTTSTGWSTSGTGLGVNAASGFAGNLIDIQVAGTSYFKFNSVNGITGTMIAGTNTGNWLNVPSGLAPGSNYGGLGTTDGDFYINTNTSYGIIILGGTGAQAPGALDVRRPILINPATSTTGSTSKYALNITGAAHTSLPASTEQSDLSFNLARTVQFSLGALTNQRAFMIQAPTYSFTGASTLTNAATFYINAAPTAGTNATITNAYALWVDAGTSRFDGNLQVDGSSIFQTNSSGTVRNIFSIQSGEDNIQFYSTINSLGASGERAMTWRPVGAATGPGFSFSGTETNGSFTLESTGTGSINLMPLGTGNVGIGTTTPVGMLNVVGAPVGKALVNLNYTGSGQNLFTASASGTTRFTLTSAGNIGINTTTTSNPITVGSDGTNGNGAYLSVGGTWTDTSSKEVKTNFHTLDSEGILAKINRLQLQGWSYKQEESVRHIGPFAEDMYDIFGVGNDRRHLAALDTAGIALVGIQGLSARVAVLQASLDILSQKLAAATVQEQASTSAAMTSDISVTSLQQEIASLSARLSLVEGQQILGAATTLDASTSAVLLEADGSFQNATISGNLMVLGRAVVSDLGVTGKMSNGLMTIAGEEGRIDVLGTLKLQKNGLGGIDMLAGKVTIDVKGNIITQGELTAAKIHVAVSDEETASLGSGVITAGKTSVMIATTAVTANSKIFVTATTATGKQPLVVTAKTAGKSFVVSLEEAVAKEVRFDWWIVN